MKSQFTDKQVSLEVLTHIYENYISKGEYNGVKFKDILKSAANDLGLTYKQVRAASSSVDKKSFRKVERSQNELVKIRSKAKWEIDTLSYPKIIKNLKLTSLWSWVLKQRKKNNYES